MVRFAETSESEPKPESDTKDKVLEGLEQVLRAVLQTQGLREPHLPTQAVLLRRIKIAKLIRLTVTWVITPETVTFLIIGVTMLLIIRIVAIRFRLRETALTKTGTGILLVAVAMIIARIPITLISHLVRRGSAIQILIRKMTKILQMLVIPTLLHSSRIAMVPGTSDDHETLVASDQVVLYAVN